MNIPALIAKAVDRIRKVRANRARERYLREKHRGFRDAMNDYTRRNLAEMFDPSGLTRTPYNDGYAEYRHDIECGEAMLRKAEVAAAIKSGPRKWMQVPAGQMLVFKKEQV